MNVSILRFEAPMMSFGAPIVSDEGRIQPYPALSMMTGLLANAFGYDRREAERHERLQEALSYAVREDVPGEKIVDYQTADLGQPHLQAKSKRDSVAWTTWGYLDQRGSGNTDTTNIRNREYWADAQYTIALHVSGLAAEEIESALIRPERPLFIGRQPCLPSKRLFQDTVEAGSLTEALRRPDTIPSGAAPRRLWRESSDGTPVTDARDWTNQIHVGERRVEETDFSE